VRRGPGRVGARDGELISSAEEVKWSSYALAGEVARIAGVIAARMAQVADERERMADLCPTRAVELRAHAERARAFARSEREAQRRWQQVHDLQA
jgi:hypothetical protein